MDYLIWLEKASWHPIICKRVRFGGDLWVWSNSFGSCLGGSHPRINAHYKRSADVFTAVRGREPGAVQDARALRKEKAEF